MKELIHQYGRIAVAAVVSLLLWELCSLFLPLAELPLADRLLVPAELPRTAGNGEVLLPEIEMRSSCLEAGVSYRLEEVLEWEPADAFAGPVLEVLEGKEDDNGLSDVRSGREAFAEDSICIEAPGVYRAKVSLLRLTDEKRIPAIVVLLVNAENE